MTGERLAVSIADISELPANQYVGLIDESAVACLAARFVVEGQKSPIWLRRNGNAARTPWSVIAGRHRLRAAERLGWSEISATEQADASSGPDELRALQIAENLDRRVLRPIERALNVVCRWRSIACQNAWDIVSHAREADEETARACGVDDRTIRRYRRLYDEIIVPFPEYFALLNAHPLGESLSAMTQIAALKLDARHDNRRVAIAKVLERDDWPTLSAALEAAGLKHSNGNRVDPANHRAVMITTWSKMPLTDKRTYLEEFPKIISKDMALRLLNSLMKEHEL